jgi:hypothetical protein
VDTIVDASDQPAEATDLWPEAAVAGWPTHGPRTMPDFCRGRRARGPVF